ncbi:MAG: type II secretion system F family protein, partial [Candidatus Parcubacteria bacterium]|nr:type II secretion system F family protein [Candidatus Parcubacteria bacterium]
MKFIYKAKNQQGQIQDGSIDGSTLDSAIKTLQGYNLVVLDIKQYQKKTFLDQILGKRRGVNGKEISLFMRQFSTLLESQVPLTDSLKALLVQSTNPRLKETIFDLLSDIDAGLPLSQAMARQSHLFGTFYIEMIKSGEITGRLQEVFIYLADYAEHEYALTSKAKSVATYPLFIIITFAVIGSVITISLAPQMMSLFKEFDAKPPLMTQILMSTGSFLSQYGVIVLICLAGLIMVVLNYLKTEEGRKFVDYWLLKTP